jgi:hypothetical protein
MVLVPESMLVAVVVALGPTVTVAIVGSLLLHVPPPVVSDSVVVYPPGHKEVMPVMPEGSAFTVTTFVVIQPVDSV